MNNDQLKKLIYDVGNTQNKASFSKIFEYFAPRVMGYLIGFGLQEEAAEEITQEVLSIVWQKAQLFNSEKGNVSTWIFTIARNRRIDRLRKNENPTYNTQDFVNALYPEENLGDKDMEIKIEKMQSKLNENEKKLIKMNFFDGKTHKIISQDLEIPLGTVKSRIRNILKKMKNN